MTDTSRTHAIAAVTSLSEGRNLVSARHGIFLVHDTDTIIGRSLLDYGEWCEPEIDLIELALHDIQACGPEAAG